MKTLAIYKIFNGQRYSDPWVALINPETKDFIFKGVGGYTGERGKGDAGELYVYDPQEMSVYVYGQKDLRKNRRGYEYVRYIGGEFLPVEKTELTKALNAAKAAKDVVGFCPENVANAGNGIARGVMSIDAEANGLYSYAFSIAVVLEDGVTQFLGRCPIDGDIDPWVRDNVLPEMEGIPINYDNYVDLLDGFITFYKTYKEGRDIIVHMGCPVEAKLFIDAHELGLTGTFEGPCPLIDISAFPEIGTSVDSYNSLHNIVVPDFEGGTHNPLYDATAALLAYKHIRCDVR